MQNTPFSTKKTLNINGRLIDLTVPRVMGILNVTPDSFFDGGEYATESAIIKRTSEMLAEGADFIDVGGYSSRPGATAVSVDEEESRVVKAISAILQNFPDTIISVDTFRSQVARKAVEAGATMVNDISGGNLDTSMFSTVAQLKVPYILMHMRGTPETMSLETHYDQLLKDLLDYFHKKCFALLQHGVADVIIDPGFGFAKTVSQNFAILSSLEKFTVLEKPLLVGLSRKSMISKTLDVNAAGALNGTTALHTAALLKGANILRVHDVREAKEVIKLFTSMQSNVTL